MCLCWVVWNFYGSVRVGVHFLIVDMGRYGWVWVGVGRCGSVWVGAQNDMSWNICMRRAHLFKLLFRQAETIYFGDVWIVSVFLYQFATLIKNKACKKTNDRWMKTSQKSYDRRTWQNIRLHFNISLRRFN